MSKHSHHRVQCIVAVSLLSVVLTTAGQPREISPQPLEISEAGDSVILEGRIAGDEIIDYQVTGAARQILSVDLLTSNAANHFNISAAGAEEAIFIGSTSGTVADVVLPESGAYIVRLYLMRSAARRGERADYSLAISLGAPEFADSLAGGPDYWSVNVSGGTSLNLRAGPSVRYKRTSVLRNNQVVQNRGCRLTGGERWCQIRATHSGVTGWVAGRYLIEAAPPRQPAMPDGGPVGNGVPFDATGTVPCATGTDQPLQQCPFGVIREGPGNAGIWIVPAAGVERHILFERGTPITANSANPLSFEKVSDLFIVRVGDERYEIPDAVVNGG